MRQLKRFFERPSLVVFVMQLLIFFAFWRMNPEVPETNLETHLLSVAAAFAVDFDSPEALIRTISGFSELNFSVIFALFLGKLNQMGLGSLLWLRFSFLVLFSAASWVFVWLGARAVARHRLNPLWLGIAIVLWLTQAYFWVGFPQVKIIFLPLFLLLLSLWAWEFDRIWLSSVAATLGVLTDWRLISLPIAVILSRLILDRSRLLRVDRILALSMPIVLAGVYFIYLSSVGHVHPVVEYFRSSGGTISFAGFNYALVLLAVYPLLYSWCFIFRARVRTLVQGLLVSAVVLPLYYFFPIDQETWISFFKGISQPLGVLSGYLEAQLEGYYKFILFVPWLFGGFILSQIALRKVDPRNFVFKAFIVLYFVNQILSLSSVEEGFFLLYPVVVLLALSEALVGDEGKLI